MKPQSYDLIGDIHGQYDKLSALLFDLDYTPTGKTWSHADGRKVIFLGDYVDRGSKIREVLQTVRGMVDAGDALAIMGNHEFNLVTYHTKSSDGRWLRPHNERYNQQNLATRRTFADCPDELHDWLEWIKHLPITLELSDLRAVHACWDDRYIGKLPPGCFLDDDLLERAATAGTTEYDAAQTLLKGPELALPPGTKFIDKEGLSHSRIRVKWWGRTTQTTFGDATMPAPTVDLLRFPLADDALQIANYAPESKPVFFGHYWLPPHSPKQPLAPNIACLDFSAGLEGPLVAYRWDGERELDACKMIVGNHH